MSCGASFAEKWAGTDCPDCEDGKIGFVNLLPFGHAESRETAGEPTLKQVIGRIRGILQSAWHDDVSRKLEEYLAELEAPAGGRDGQLSQGITGDTGVRTDSVPDREVAAKQGAVTSQTLEIDESVTVYIHAHCSACESGSCEHCAAAVKEANGYRGVALASGVTEPGALEQQAWNLYYDRHAKVAEEIVESLMIFAAPLRERVAELERERDRLEKAVVWVVRDASYKAPEQIGEVGYRWVGRLRAALSPDSQDGKKGMEG